MPTSVTRRIGSSQWPTVSFSERRVKHSFVSPETRFSGQQSLALWAKELLSLSNHLDRGRKLGGGRLQMKCPSSRLGEAILPGLRAPRIAVFPNNKGIVWKTLLLAAGKTPAQGDGRRLGKAQG